MRARIEVSGLRELRASLKAADSALPKQLRLALNEASTLVVGYAQARMPSKSGRARASLKAQSSQTEARVALGGRRAPYAPWLDFGGQGKVKGRPPQRRFIKGGRYVYPGLEANRDKITKVMEDALTRVARDAGLEVSSGG